MKKLFLLTCLSALIMAPPARAQVQQYEVTNPYIFSIGDFLQPYVYGTNNQVFPWYTVMDTVYGAYQATDTAAQKISGFNHQITFKTHFTRIAGATTTAYYTIYANSDSSTQQDYQPYAPTYTYTYSAEPKYVKNLFNGDWDALHSYTLTTSSTQHDTYILPYSNSYTNFMLVLYDATTGAEISWNSGLIIR
jgi:hypothetical protein